MSVDWQIWTHADGKYWMAATFTNGWGKSPWFSSLFALAFCAASLWLFTVQAFWFRKPTWWTGMEAVDFLMSAHGWKYPIQLDGQRIGQEWNLSGWWLWKWWRVNRWVMAEYDSMGDELQQEWLLVYFSWTIGTKGGSCRNAICCTRCYHSSALSSKWFLELFKTVLCLF